MRQECFSKLRQFILERSPTKGTSGFEYGYLNKGKIESAGYSACHAGFNYREGFIGADGIYTMYVRPYENGGAAGEATRAWAEWISGTDRNPWAGVADEMDVDEIANHGWVITNLDQPANLIANFCIATRQAGEHPNQVAQWHKLVTKDGVKDKALAYFFAQNLDMIGADTNTIAFRSGQRGHSPIEACEMSPQAVFSFCNGIKHQPLQPFRVSPKYIPCNAIWYPKGGEDGSGSLPYPYTRNVSADSQYGTFLKNTYPIAGKVPSKRKFAVEAPSPSTPYYCDGNHVRSAAEWLEIIKLEEKRIADEQHQSAKIAA